MKLKLLTAAAALLMAGSAQAAVVTTTTNISVPQSTAGLYLNVVTGTTGTSDTSPPTGWDLNPWGSNSLMFFWPSTGGGVAGTTGGSYLDLTAGSVISSASLFSRSTTAAASAAFDTAGSHILGFSFLNEVTGITNYGYLRFTTTGPNGVPATINGWSYENTGAAITVAGAIPEPASWAMMILGVGAMGFAMRRRQVRTSVAYA